MQTLTNSKSTIFCLAIELVLSLYRVKFIHHYAATYVCNCILLACVIEVATSSDIVCDIWILVDDQNYLVVTYMRKPNF